MQQHNRRIIFFICKQGEFKEGASATLQGTHTIHLHHAHSDCHCHSPTPPHLHLPFPRQLLSSHGAPRAGHLHCSVTRSLWLETDGKYESGQPSLAWTRLNAQGLGGIRWNPCWRSAKSFAGHTRGRLDGGGAARRHSPTNQRSWKLSPEQSGLRNEGRPEPVCLGLFCGISSPARSATSSDGELQETAAAETTAQGAQGALRCTQCGPAADALRACTVGGLMHHMCQKHGGQLEDSVGQVHRLNRPGLCVLRHNQIAAKSPVQLLWALLCRYCCRLLLAVIPKGVDRNSELKQRRQLWEAGQVSVLIGKVLGQQNSGPLRRTAGKTQPQTEEQRGKRACALTARGSISKAMKGLVGGAAQGSADCRRNSTTALIPRSSGIGTHPTRVECDEGARIAWGEGRCKLWRGARRGSKVEAKQVSLRCTTSNCRL